MYKFLILAFLMCLNTPACAKIQGKVDIGAAFIDIDILESGKTIDKRHLKAIKGDATINVYGGWFLRPNFIVAGGEGKLDTFTIGVGHFLPVHPKLLLMPSVGIGFSYLRTKIDMEEMGLFDLTEKFHSTSPYVALEFAYRLADCFTIMGMYQYAWSRTHTIIKPFVHDRSHSEGPNYALGFDYSLNSKWSITGGLGYNITLTHEKHGLRGKGAKLGIAYYF